MVQAGVTRSQLDLVQVDLQNPESLINAANYVEKEHPDLDILVNNAGIAADMQKPALDTPISDYKETLDINFGELCKLFNTFYPLLNKIKAKL